MRYFVFSLTGTKLLALEETAPATAGLILVEGSPVVKFTGILLFRLVVKGKSPLAEVSFLIWDFMFYI